MKEKEYIEYEDGTRVELSEDDAPELTEEFFRNAKPFGELPEDLKAGLQSLKKTSAATREFVGLYVNPDTLARYQATGPGWESRMQEALEKGV